MDNAIILLQLLRSTIQLESQLSSEHYDEYEAIKSLVDKNWEVLNKNGIKKEISPA